MNEPGIDSLQVEYKGSKLESRAAKEVAVERSTRLSCMQQVVNLD